MARVLICTVDAALVDFLTGILANEGYGVEVVERAGEAIQKILKHKYQAIIMGVHTKEASGFDTVQTIQIINDIDIDLPIIALADEPSLETHREVRKEKVFYYFLKPVEAEEVREVVKSAVSRYQSRNLCKGE